MAFGFNGDRSKADIDTLISGAIEALRTALTELIDGKADSSHTHDAGDITSGTLPVERGGTGQTTLQALRSAMGLGNTTGALPVANGGTGKTYGFGWQRLATSTNDTAMSYNLSGYSEVMFAANCTYVNQGSQAYLGSVVLPVGLLSASTSKEVYLTGGDNTTTAGTGRGFALRCTSTKATPATRTVDGTPRPTTWYVYAR